MTLEVSRPQRRVTNSRCPHARARGGAPIPASSVSRPDPRHLFAPPGRRVTISFSRILVRRFRFGAMRRQRVALTDRASMDKDERQRGSVPPYTADGADADDDGVVAAAPASYGVIANRRH